MHNWRKAEIVKGCLVMSRTRGRMVAGATKLTVSREQLPLLLLDRELGLQGGRIGRVTA